MEALHACAIKALTESGKDPPLAVCFGGQDREEAAWRDALVPDGWERLTVSLDRCPTWSPRETDTRPILLVAPVVGVGDGARWSLSDDGWRGQPSLGAALLLRAARRAVPGQRLAAFLPSGAFATGYSEPRAVLHEAATVRLLVERDGRWLNDLGVHHSYQMSLLCVERRRSGDDEEQSPARFLRLPETIAPEELDRELRVLFRQGGGTTQFGYVKRERLDPSRPLRVASFDPQQHVRSQTLRTIGNVVPLGDLVAISAGRHRPAAGGRDAQGGVPVLTGRDIAAGTKPNGDEGGVRNPDARMLLRPDDICTPSMRAHDGPLHIHRITEADLPLVASHTILVLRPTKSLATNQIPFLVDYLGSPRAAALLSFETAGGIRLRASQLAALPVPVPDDTLLETLHDLRVAAGQFRTWAQQVDVAIAGLFGEALADAGVLELRSVGNLLRRRVTAARRVDDLGHRVQFLYPLPVALPWRLATTSNDDLEGYATVLRCAESLAGYLASLAILMSGAIGRELGGVKSIRDKLARTSQGVSMTDWTAIVQDAAAAKTCKLVEPGTPFAELTETMAPGAVATIALAELTDLRNDNAHNRGPTGTRVAEAREEALRWLAIIYDACGWLCDYPLRSIETTTWDSFANKGTYAYRELEGDHYLVPPESATTDSSTLSTANLYLVDRGGTLHRLSPLITWHECAKCHIPSAFVLDKYDRNTGVCHMRAMDHNHSLESDALATGFKRFGLIPDETRATG